VENGQLEVIIDENDGEDVEKCQSPQDRPFCCCLVVVSTGLIYIARVYTSVVHREQPVAGGSSGMLSRLARTSADHLPFCSWAIMRSMSSAELPLALVLSSSSMLRSFALSASSPALEIIPHLIHISARSAMVRLVHFGM